MSSRTQTTEVLLRWKYVRQAVGRALYSLEQFTISGAKHSDTSQTHAKEESLFSCRVERKGRNKVITFVLILIHNVSFNSAHIFHAFCEPETKAMGAGAPGYLILPNQHVLIPQLSFHFVCSTFYYNVPMPRG